MQAFMSSLFCRTKPEVSSPTSSFSTTAVTTTSPTTTIMPSLPAIPITIKKAMASTTAAEARPSGSPKAFLGGKKEEGEEDEDDDTITVATALSNATTTKSMVDNENNAEFSQLDLVFVVDCTGSMGAYIQAAQESIHSIITRLAHDDGVSVRFGLICYRDHAPQDSTYVTRLFPFTSHLPTIISNVNSMTAEGGGDGPEAMADALHDLLHLDWRFSNPSSSLPSSSFPTPNTSKVAVLIADAPPHGLGERGDGFPNGCPLNHDPLAITRDLASLGITLYTVGCEPAISTYENCKDLLIFMAEATGGQALVLESANLLAAVILGGAQEEVGLTRLEREVDAMIRGGGREGEEEEGAGGGEAEEVFVARVEEALRKRGTKTKQLKTNLRRMTSAQAEMIGSCSSLAEARTRLDCRGGREGAEEEEEEEEEGGATMLAVRAGMSSLSCCSFAPAALSEECGGTGGTLPSPRSRPGLGGKGRREGGRDGTRGRVRLMAHDLLSRRGGADTVPTTEGPAAAAAAAAADATAGVGMLSRGASWGHEKWLSATTSTVTDGCPAAFSTSPSSSYASSSCSPSPGAPSSSPACTTTLMGDGAGASESGGGGEGGREGGRAEVAEAEITVDQIRRLVRKAQSLRGEGLRASQSFTASSSSSTSSSSSSSPPPSCQHAPTI